MSEAVKDTLASGQPASTAPAEPSLTARVVKGAGWVFAGRLVGRGMDLVRLVILARLLSPEDFGLFGIVMLAIAVLETFSQTGFNTALVQRKDDAEAYLDTAWTVQVIRRLILAAILFGSAPVVGWFFKEPRAVPLVRVMSASVALSGFINIGIIYFQKELQFHKQVLYNLLTAVVSLIVGVVLAYKLRSVWALLWAGLAGTVAQCILSYWLHPYRPRPRLDRAQVAELFRFGRWMLGSAIVTFLATRGDSALLGKMLGAATLGVYQVAYNVANTPATEITNLASAVMMPAYAKVQDDKARLARAFLQVFEVVLTLALPLTVFIVLAAPDIVLGLLGAKWQAAVFPIQVLAVSGLLRAIAATGWPVFVGTGKPHLSFWMNLGRALVMAAIIYPLTDRFGMGGASLSVVLGVAATLPIWARARAITGVGWTELVARSRGALIEALCVALGVCTVRLMCPASSAMTLLLEVAAAGIFGVIGACFCARRLRSGFPGLVLRSWREVISAWRPLRAWQERRV